jgi:putative FmdB family regulatory protein
MPLYDYKCQECGYVFEELQTMSDDPITICPQCKKEAVKKLFSKPTGIMGMDDPKEYYENVIKPDAKRIAQKINDGDENLAADILGDSS